MAGDCIEFVPCTPGGPGPGPEPCVPPRMCARFAGISGPDQWSLPDNVESFSLSIVCGPITITDCAGEATVMNEGCGNLQFAAPGGPCAPGSFCTPFTVDIPDGSAVYINWLELCEDGA